MASPVPRSGPNYTQAIRRVGVGNESARSGGAVPQQARLLTPAGLGTMIESLRRMGYEVIGPTVRDGSIVYERLKSAAELPAGWTDEQRPGHYRLKPRPDRALFGFSVGPQSWKRFLHPADVPLWSAERRKGTFRILDNEVERRGPYAFLGVRACELAAIAVQDRVLTGGEYREPIYAERRQDVFIVAVNCAQAADTCFCASMGTGPRVRSGFDLLLTELVGPEGHRFVAEAGTRRGAQVLAELETTSAGEEDLHAANAAVELAAGQQVRSLNTTGLKQLLYESFDSPHWESIASRCLTCANCTMVCPTCFCTSVDDATDVTADHAARRRRWDSC